MSSLSQEICHLEKKGNHDTQKFQNVTYNVITKDFSTVELDICMYVSVYRCPICPYMSHNIPVFHVFFCLFSHYIQHHCRKCGRIFCDDCSKNHASLPSLGYSEPVRVCNECYKELTSTQNIQQFSEVRKTCLKYCPYIMLWVKFNIQ